ncbi:PilZ domain-containing protein [bacterium]|nr:PilZ domain-containing protein [bacterium]
MGSEVFRGDTFVERRQHPRLPMKLQVCYQTLEKQDSEKVKKSVSMDMSATGMSLRSAQEMFTHETVTVQLFVPAMEQRSRMSILKSCPEEHCRKVTILSRVVWCTVAENKCFILGLEFLDVSLDDQEYINQFLQDYRMPEPNMINR